MRRWWTLAAGIAFALLLTLAAATMSGFPLLDDPSPVMRAARPIAAIAGVLLLIVDVLLPVPSSPIMVANGALFGIAGGTLLSLAGSVGAVLAGFALGRAGNDLIRRVVTPREHERAGTLLRRWGVFAIAISRPIPIVAETVAILAGGSPVTWTQALLAAIAGSLVPAAVYAWAGASAQTPGMQTMIFAGVIAIASLLFVAGRRIGVAVVLLALAIPSPAAVLKKEIVVTAARDEQPRDQASAALTVLDREDIRALPAASLAEVLAFVPGVTMMYESGASGVPVITSRGFFGGGEVEYVKLLVDGVPVGDAESGNADWQRFRASEIERVEFLHGPGSALYGDTALGGVIQVFTSREGGEVHLAAGSFDTRELGVHYRMDLANGLHLDASGGAWSTGGFREHAAADGRDARLALERLGDGARWRVDGEASRVAREQPGALTRAEIAGDREQSNELFRFDEQTTNRGRIGAAFDSFGATPIRATVYGIRRDDDNLRTLLLVPGFGTSAFRALTTNVGGGTLEVSRESTRGVVRAGADLERARVSMRYASAEERGRRDRIGLFATGAWTFGGRYRLSAGLRRDEIRDDMSFARTSSAWSPRAGLNVGLGSGVSLFVQLSSAFKTPTLDQLFDPRPYPDGAGGTFTISNPDLRPQRARNVEAGLSRTTPRSEWSFVAYRMNVRDEIDFDPQTYSYRNIGTSLHRGIEASGAFAKNARLSPRVMYAWTSVADRATPDVQLKNIPEHTAQLLLHWRVTPTTAAEVAWRWRDGFTLDDAGTFRAPSVSRIDLRVARDVRRVRVQADVLNALDVNYNEVGYVLMDFAGKPVALENPAPGRALRLGLRWMF
ncbi:MAG: TonB-dependent receptor domain-containing protein [Thermoanaerobaculia bacterium]